MSNQIKPLEPYCINSRLTPSPNSAMELMQMSRPVSRRPRKSVPDARQGELFSGFDSPPEHDVAPVEDGVATQHAPSAPDVQPAEPAASAAARGERLSPPATLQDVLDILVASESNLNRLAGKASAIRTTGRALARPLADIPTNPEALNRLLGSVRPAAVGIKPRNWSGVRSRLLGAMRDAGVDVLPSRYGAKLSPEWEALRDRLPSKRMNHGLSRLVSHLHRSGASPSTVALADFEAFRSALVDRSLKPKPEGVWRDSLKLWNVAVDTVPGWPQIRPEIPADKRRYAYDWCAFEESFATDVEAYLTRGAEPDVFSDDYRRPLSATTIYKRRQGLAQIATALLKTGFAAKELVSLAVLVQPANARAALRQLHDERGGKKEYLAWQARLLVMTARHWVKDDTAVADLKELPLRLFTPVPGMKAKNRERLRQFDVPANVDALLTLPARVFAEVEKVQRPTGKDARRALFALGVELILVTALRIANVTALERGKTLVQVQRGRQRRWHVVIPPQDSKTGAPLESLLPETSAAMMELFWTKYRPLIRKEGGDILFVTRSYDHRSPVSFAVQIKKFIATEIGLEVNVHLFRHLATKLYLEKHPHDLETVRRLLGHTSLATTLRAYAELQSASAFERWDAVLAEARAAPVVPRGRKPANLTAGAR